MIAVRRQDFSAHVGYCFRAWMFASLMNRDVDYQRWRKIYILPYCSLKLPIQIVKKMVDYIHDYDQWWNEVARIGRRNRISQHSLVIVPGFLKCHYFLLFLRSGQDLFWAFEKDAKTILSEKSMIFKWVMGLRLGNALIGYRENKCVFTERIQYI